jgi:oxygen-independent coproporphyrinogen-3 oxidase
VLTNDDLIIRKHILNIMCKGTTTWNNHIEPCQALFDGIERLQPLADDRLIELNSWSVKVTEAGKPFLRNVCMALDERLWADKPGTQLFSMAV